MEFCKSEGITRHFTTPGTPQQNERMNITIMERARCIRLNAGLPKEFWAEATNMAVYIINRSPGITIDLQIPEEKWTSRKVDYSDLRTFGFQLMFMCRNKNVPNLTQNQSHAYSWVSRKQ